MSLVFVLGIIIIVSNTLTFNLLKDIKLDIDSKNIKKLLRKDLLNFIGAAVIGDYYRKYILL